MNKCAMIAAVTALVAGAHLSWAASAGANDAPDGRGGAAAGGSTAVGSAPASCDLPAFGWADCQVVKALPDDMVKVTLHGSMFDERVDCNLNELGTNDQLNTYTAELYPGWTGTLWHNNYGKTVYADLRCSSPSPFPIWANLEVWRE